MVPLARLAVDRTSRGRRLGSVLLAGALRKAVAAGEAVPARLVVDAIDDRAARLYARHGFVPVPEHPSRLYRCLKDLRLSLQATERS